MNKRWGVLLDGHNFDLLDWHEGLNSHFDPVVEKRTINAADRFVLFSSRFSNRTGAAKVHEHAEVIVDGINGAMAILKRADRVTIGGVADFDSDPPKIHGFARGVVMTGRSRMVATGVVLRADGTPVPPPPPQPSAAQHWLSLSQRSDHVADLLTYAARADNWFDIYKMIEAAIDLAGTEKTLVKMCGKEVLCGSAWKRDPVSGVIGVE